MIPSVRQEYNNSFSEKRYQEFLRYIDASFDHHPPFRIAETPVFLPMYLKHRLFEACEMNADVICNEDFKSLTERALRPHFRVPGEDDHTLFLQMDYGICRDEEGKLKPMLIEVQGFPSLYHYQDYIANTYRQFFPIPEGFFHLFHRRTEEEYHQLLNEIILAGEKPEHVVLVDIEPHSQATRIDFYAASKKMGIPVKCISELKVDGRDVYYLDGSRKVEVRRIYSRVIFDELLTKRHLHREFYFTEEINAAYVGHPNWFFRISKYTLPFLKNPYVPESLFLDELEEYPEDLENYVLKPLFSFSGTGVLFHVTREDIESIHDRSNYILQRKVHYEPVVQALDGGVKCEIRMLMLWKPGEARPAIVNNLARLTRGEMVGVKFNKDKTWVGGSVAFFEPG